MQEHWLYQFELEDMSKLLSGCKWATRAVDEVDPILPLHKSRGRASARAVTIWKEDLDPLIEQEKDGSNRLHVVTLKTNMQPLNIINAYMPTQSGSDISTYATLLDKIHEICQKYSNLILVLGWDMNASLCRPRLKSRITFS